jgi:hypothetical protein
VPDKGAVMPVDGVPVPLLTKPRQVAQVMGLPVCDAGGPAWHPEQPGTAVASVHVIGGTRCRTA